MKAQRMYEILARCIEFWHEWAWLLIGSALMALFWGIILNDLITFFSK